MTVAAPPYTTSEVVAAWMATTLKGGPTFESYTTPTRNNVETYIDLVSGQIDMHLGMAGYKLPLTSLPGEDWPTHQTSWLMLVATFGSVAISGGFALKPMPATTPSRKGSTGNIFQDLYMAELDKVYDMQTGKSAFRLRADYYYGTNADKNLSQPIGPMTDFMEGRFDPERFLTEREVINRMLVIQDALRDKDIAWDYMYGLFGLNKGLGEVSGERYVIG